MKMYQYHGIILLEVGLPSVDPRLVPVAKVFLGFLLRGLLFPLLGRWG